MRELTLILTDFYLDTVPMDDVATAPRLPALETVLARAQMIPSEDWRDWVWRHLGLPPVARIPIAALARLAESTAGAPTSAGQWWLAQCVHLEAGIDRVFLRPEAPALTDEEWRTLESGFNAAFAAAGFRLIDGRATQGYLLSKANLESDTLDPVKVWGKDIRHALPTGPDGAMLKRLMTEIQMWLHEHPVNIARQDRGATIVNGLWIWGGGLWPEMANERTLPALRADDDFLRGLWRLVGGMSEPLPATLHAIDLGRSEAMIVALPSSSGEVRPAQALENLERDWFEPALIGVKKGDIARLQLHLNGRLVSLGRRDSWRFWRRRRAWFESLA